MQIFWGIGSRSACRIFVLIFGAQMRSLSSRHGNVPVCNLRADEATTPKEKQTREHGALISL